MRVTLAEKDPLFAGEVGTIRSIAVTAIVRSIGARPCILCRQFSLVLHGRAR